MNQNDLLNDKIIALFASAESSKSYRHLGVKQLELDKAG